MALAGRPKKRKANAAVLVDDGRLVALKLDSPDALPLDGQPRRLLAYGLPGLSKREFADGLRQLADLLEQPGTREL